MEQSFLENILELDEALLTINMRDISILPLQTGVERVIQERVVLAAIAVSSKRISAFVEVFEREGGVVSFNTEPPAHIFPKGERPVVSLRGAFAEFEVELPLVEASPEKVLLRRYDTGALKVLPTDSVAMEAQIWQLLETHEA